MAAEVTWLGHACWQIREGASTILIDPFLDESPVAKLKADQVNPNFILISHGHFDHIADAASIANRTNAMVYSNYEIVTWLQSKHGVKNVTGMNLGGSVATPFGRVKLTVAHHSSQLPDGSYGGNPSGFLISLATSKLYFACDTALFGDMKLIGAAGIDLAVLPIGDVFTMGIEDSIEATQLIQPRRVAPSHFGTWPPIAADAKRWAELVRQQTKAEPICPEIGKPFTI